MAIELTEEQQLIVNIARDFAINEVRPRIPEIDKSEYRPMDLYKRCVELGFRGITIPEEHGGLGQNLVTQLLITEQVAKEHVAVALMTGNALAKPLIAIGTPVQKEKWLAKLAAGDLVFGFCFTEASAGSDSKAIQTTAVKDGDEWIINGTKTFITGCQTYDGFLVSAKTNETEPGGISAFVVERSTPGFSASEPWDKLGWHGTETGEIYLRNVRVPAENMLGVENKGLHVVFYTLDVGRLNMAVHALGYAEGAFEKAVDYAKQRVQFGRPITDFQVIQHYIADMATKIEVSRAMTFHAAALADAGKPFSKEASMAKLFATEMACWVTDKAIQICGGYGLINSGGIERYFRDARILTIGEGTSEVQKEIIAKMILSQK